MKILGVETLHAGWGRYLRVRVGGPDGGEFAREVEDHGDAAAVLAYDPVRRTALLARQLRVPALLSGGETTLLEAAAGRIEGGEDPETCIRREAEEELGLRLGALESVVAMRALPGVSTERIHLFLAAYGAADRIGAGGGTDDDEDIEVVEAPLADLAAAADAGTLSDGKTLVLLQTLRLRRPDLFP